MTTIGQRTQEDIYGGHEPRELPLYTLGEAARYLHLASATLTAWVKGRRYPKLAGAGYSEPLISLEPGSGGLLSFNNLIEAHVLRSLRTRHGVPMRGIRIALDYAREEHGIARLFLSDELKTVAEDPGAQGVGALFIEKLGTVENISAGGQLVMKRALRRHLERVERDPEGMPRRLYPFVVPSDAGDRSILIDPRIAFGSPVLAHRGIRVSTIVDRVDAGETIEHIADNYGLEASEVAGALDYYEQAA